MTKQSEGFILNPNDPPDRQYRLCRGPNGTISAQCVTDESLFASLTFVRLHSTSAEAKDTLRRLAGDGT